MTKPLAQYLREQVVVAAVINLLLNGGLAWLLYRHLPMVPLKGAQSVTGDLLVMTFLIPLLISLIVTPLVRLDAARGRVARAPIPGSALGLLRRLPTNSLLLGLLLGLAALVVIGGLSLGILNLSGLDGLSFPAFALLKAGVAALVAFWVTRWIVLRALSGTPARGL